jgi:uncharacterized protein (TIGR03663 family)
VTQRKKRELAVALDHATATTDAMPVASNNPSATNRSPFVTAPLRWSISVESLCWITLLLAAIASRYWNLGYRALHHDESLHAYYSYKFATGEIPYVHDPLMHGPFLFFGNAIVYLLFGASDATSRYLPALFGVVLVGLPWLLRGRNFLGRWGALAASIMLLISPSFLYYTRYIRHDPYTSVGGLLLCIAIFRYLERPQRRWMIIAFACVAFLIANHEIVFAIVLAFIIVLWGRSSGVASARWFLSTWLPPDWGCWCWSSAGS